MSDSPTPQQICSRAAEIIRDKGWIKSKMTSPEGMCMSFAIHKAISEHIPAGSNPMYLKAINLLSDYLNIRPFIPSVWNDNMDRTVEEVLEALEGVGSSCE